MCKKQNVLYTIAINISYIEWFFWGGRLYGDGAYNGNESDPHITIVIGATNGLYSDDVGWIDTC